MTLKDAIRLAASRAGLVVDRWPPRGSLERALEELMGRYEVDSVVDVGANEGQWASSVRRIGYAGPLLSLEPVSETYSRLSSRASSDRMWTTLQVAASDAPAELTINVPEATGMASFREIDGELIDSYANAEEVRRLSTTRRRETVQAVTLDSLDVPGERVLLKSDTQGYDLEVFTGASKLLRRTVILQCELAVLPFYRDMSNRWLDIIEWALAQGFDLAGVFKVATDAFGRQVEIDAVFVNAARCPSQP